jgi:mannose-6-phosphate isomerase-like protein (cupin superfamily)
MSIAIIAPEDWRMAPPGERGTHANMKIAKENPYLCLLEEKPNSYNKTHSHSEPEVFIVLEGRMIFNGRWCEKGTVIFVPANEDYWYATGSEHCVISLMRPKDRGQKRNAVEAVAAE